VAQQSVHRKTLASQPVGAGQRGVQLVVVVDEQ
jgi:hypothetical protein